MSFGCVRKFKKVALIKNLKIFRILPKSFLLLSFLMCIYKQIILLKDSMCLEKCTNLKYIAQ